MLGHLHVTHNNNKKFHPWDNADFLVTMTEISKSATILGPLEGFVVVVKVFLSLYIN